MSGIIFSLTISIGLPLIALCYSVIKKCTIPFILGILAFVISQILIRIPLLEYLQSHSTDYLMFRTMRPILFSIILGLSAGIFEELARFIMMHFFMKQRNWRTGFIFGAGHGGIEAILFLGVQAIIMLSSPLAYAYNVNFWLGGMERLFAMLLHIGLSIIVLQAVVQKKFMYVFIAIIIHGFIDSLIGILPLFLSQHVALISIELSLIFVALIVFTYTLFIKRKGVLA